MIHDWWAVEMRKLAAATDDARAAIEHVLEIFEHPEDQDCSDCFERWMDEAAGGSGAEVDDFPEVLTEEHVIRILALEDAVLVRHALDQWLTALGARRARRVEAAIEEGRAWGERAEDPPDPVLDGAMVPGRGM